VAVEGEVQNATHDRYAIHLASRIQPVVEHVHSIFLDRDHFDGLPRVLVPLNTFNGSKLGMTNGGFGGDRCLLAITAAIGSQIAQNAEKFHFFFKSFS
jgi:hypothetical protein